MSEVREIVTRAVLAKGRKTFRINERTYYISFCLNLHIIRGTSQNILSFTI